MAPPYLANKFDKIHLDFIEKLPEIDGYRNCLVIIDNASGWVVAIPIKDIEAFHVAYLVWTRWILEYGFPRVA